MALLAAAFLLSLLLTVHGEYLQPPEISIGSSLLSSVTANSTCDGVSYIVVTPLGTTNSTDSCNSFPAAAIDGALSSQWLSAPGDNVVEFTIGVTGLELSQVHMTFTSPLPRMMTVETVSQSTGVRNLLHVLAVDPAVCNSSPAGSVCRTFSNITISSDSGGIFLEWPLSLGRTDDMSVEFLDLVAASSIIFTLSGFDPSLTDPMEQYFAVSEIALRGRCACNGHASRASVAESSCSCQCQHDTTGQYCTECAAGFQFSPWRRASPDCPFVCQSDSCDVGGAVRDVMCTTTNCTCRNNIGGDTCDEPNSGYYVPSLQATSVEAETGFIVETGQMVVVDSDPANIPVFRGLGYASYSLPEDISKTIQWTLNIPVTSVYYMALTYHLPIREGENAFTANFMLSRNTLMMQTQLPVPICPSPPCSTLSRTTVTLEQGTWTVGLHFAERSIPTPEFYIDTVFAFPVTFVEASLLGNDSQRFVDNCTVQNNELVESFCQQSSFSLSAFFYDGAFDCDCDPNGSNGTVCEPLGGQCPCYSPASPENVPSTDRQCSVCPRYYYGPTNSGCMPCGCVADNKLCDGSSGQCTCPMNVDGRTCDQCTDLSFGYDTTTGCQTCSCDPLGTAVCDNVTGDCQCRPLVSGNLCDSCDFGAYNLTASGCVPCACDPNGSVGPNCSSGGLCTCKPQVNGDKCSACVDGSFYFPPSPSSSGCLTCVCSGVTTSCTAYIGEYTNEVLVGPPSADLSGWTLATLNGDSVEQLAVPPNIVQTNTSSYLMVSTLNVDPSITGVVYWSLPRTLVTGNDWLLSYGGSIELTLSVVGSLALPEIILVAGNTMATAQLSPAPSDTTQTYSVILSEGFWQSKADGSVLLRDTFLQVLAQLDFILITALDTGTTSSTLSAAAYNSATSAGTSVLPIEQCSCPLEYTGLSCEHCSPGYYRLNGTCVPCNCNNRSATCDEYTGICLSCTANTSGPNCERCTDGFFNSNPTGEPLQCQLCPCDNTTSTSSSCTALADGSPMCTCNRGYTGPVCDQCDEGFHGNPPAVPCMSCECNGNIAPSVLGSCNVSTGECLICTNNATGQQCEQCMDGFFGDATAQQCQMCSCAPIGSLSLICDRVSGQCPCRTGVDGQMCDMCELEMWNLASGTGCEPCGCDTVGSFNTSSTSSCDIITGQCNCKPGVTGRTCDACNVSFYNFSNEGCTECGCGAGTSNASCLQLTGQCFCSPGVIGRTCDMCQPYFENLTASGCQDCGECVDRLVSIVTTIEALLQEVVSSVNTLVALHQLDVVGLNNLSMRVDEILININNSEAAMSALYARFAMLISSQDSLSAWLGHLESTLDGLQPRIQMLIDQSDIQLTDITAQETAMTGALVAAVELSDYLQLAQIDLLAWQLEANDIHENITVIHSSVTAVDFGSNITSADADAGFIETVLSTAQSADTMSQVQQGQAEDLGRRLASLQERNSFADSQQQLLVTNLTGLEAVADDVANISADITSITAFVNSSISVSVANSTVVSALVDSAAGLLAQIRLLLEQLAIALELTVVTPDMVLNADSMPQPLPQALADLQESLTGLLQLLIGVRTHVVAAERHGADISTAAVEIERILRPSLALGADALSVVTDYEQAVENINLALNISTAANNTATMAYQQATQLIAQGHIQRAAQLLNISQALLAELEALEQLAIAALQQAGLADAASLRATAQVQELQAIASYIANLTAQLDAIAASATLDVDTALQSVSDDAMCVSKAYANVSSTSQMILSNIARTMDTVAQLGNVVQNTTATAASARSLLSDANAALDERVALLDQIASEHQNTSDLNRTAFSELSDLRTRLEAIKQAAARISVAVRLDGNSSLGYSTPQEVVQSNYLFVSLFFRPEVFSGTLFSTPTLAGQPLSLLVLGGGVALSYPTSMSDRMLTRVTFPVEVDWYHVLATEDSSSGTGSSVRLTVAEFGGGRQWSTSEVISGPGLNYSTSSEVTLGGGPPFEGMNNYFTGCIDGVELNNVPLPLLTPSLPPGTCGRPCGPRPPVEADRPFESGTWFQGRGFVELLSVPTGNRLTLTLWFRTLLPEGLLFQGTGVTNANQFVAVFLSEGRLHLASSLAGTDAFTVSTVGQYNDGSWHYVSVTVENQTGYIDVDLGVEMVTGNSTFAITMETRNLSAIVHFGGLPPELTNNSPLDFTTGFAGCMRGIVLNGQSLSLSESTHSEQVQFEGCPAEVVSGVRFMGEGLAEFQPYTAAIISVAFSFKTEQLAGVLLEAYPLQVSIYHSHVRVSFDRVVLETTMPGYSDNMWHSVLVTATFNSLQLTVDGESWLRMDPLDVTLTADSAILVCGTERTDARIANSFRGCIRNIVINDVQLLDFNAAVRLDGVALYGCRPAVPDVISSSSSVVLPSATPSSSFVLTSAVTSSVVVDLTSSVADTESASSSSVVSMTTSLVVTSSVPVSTQPPVSTSQVVTQTSESPSPSPSPATSTTLQSSQPSSPTSTLESSSVSLPIPSSSSLSLTPTPSGTSLVIADSSVPPSPSPSITTLPLPPPPPPLPPPSQSAVIATTSTSVFASVSSLVASQTPAPSSVSESTSSVIVSESPSSTQETPTPSLAVPTTSSTSSTEASSSASIEVTPTTLTTSVVTTDISPTPTQPTTTVPSISSVASSAPSPSETTPPPMTPTTVLTTPSPTPTPEPPALSGVYGSFLSFAVSEEDLKVGFNITLEFRALSSEGIVLFVGNNSVGDFLALELKAGYLVYSYNLGAETAVLRSRQTYDDGQFHMVSLYRQREVGSITVDGSDVVSGRPAGMFVGLDIAQEVLFLGGLPAGVPPRGILGPGEASRPSVIACFHTLSINTKPLDLSAPLDSQGITECPDSVTNEATFRGNGFVQILDTFSPGVAFSVSLWFRTTVCDGILFYLANLDPSANDYTSLELIGGDLRFTFDNGAGAVALEYLSTNSTSLCNEQWVSVVVTKNGISGEMSVNEESVAMESSELVNLLAVDATHPLYLGGVPNDVRSSQLVDTPDFMGCMRDVIVTSDGTTTKPNFMQASLLVNATAGICQMDVAMP